jgi:hypothetical protein
VAHGDGSEKLERPRGEAPRRIWYRVDEVQLRRLRVSESAFLLWVLAALVLVWLVVALLLVFL